MNIQDLLGSNPYFSAGAGVVGLTALSGLAFKTAGRAAFLLKRRLLVTIEIPIRDGIYPWFLEWMAKRNHINAQPEKLSLMERFVSQRFHQLQVETRLTKHENGSISSSFSLVPGNGKHFFKYKSAWFQVERNRTSTMVSFFIYLSS
jgi:chaperone BCS1